MGTNYYLITTDKFFVEEYFINDFNFTDEPYLAYEIHLCKCSLGWKTLFESHMMAYTSFETLCSFLREHKDKFKIYDDSFDMTFEVEEVIQYLMLRQSAPGFTDHLEQLTKENLNNDYLQYYWNDSQGYNFIDQPFC